MTNDERMLRELVATWLEASKAGDTDKVLSLMTEDVVFLVPGQPPMNKAAFAAAARQQAGPRPLQIDGTSDIQEIQVAGDLAFLWSKLAVTVTFPDGGDVVRREGHTLTVFKREDGRWLLARDANLLVRVG